MNQPGMERRLERASMDPRKLVYFASIVEQGSLNKAAKMLGVSQPALSTSMDRFERDLGSPLLERSAGGVSPTPLGEVLYAHARLIREELERASTRLAPRSADGVSSISFGTLPSLVTGIVPAAVSRWRVDHPTATLRVVEKNQLELLLGLLRGELDFIVAQTEVYDFLEGLRQRVMFRDRLHVLARPGHPALEIGDPDWTRLASYPWVVQMVGRQRMLLERLLADEDIGLPTQLTESGSVEFIKAMVASTDSLAMLPAAAVTAEIEAGSIVPVSIDGPLLHRDIAVLFRDGVALGEPSRDLLRLIEAEGSLRSRDPVTQQAGGAAE